MAGNQYSTPHIVLWPSSVGIKNSFSHFKVRPIDTIIAVINLLLLIFYVLFGNMIKWGVLWIRAFHRKIILRIDGKNYSIGYLDKKLIVNEFLRYQESGSGIITGQRLGGRLFLQTIVRSRDISTEIQNAFNRQYELEFYDTKENKYKMIIIHLSRDGFKSYLTLRGQNVLQNDQIPKNSTLEINTISNEESFIKMLGQSLRDIDNDIWRDIYKDKIKPHMDKK